MDMRCYAVGYKKSTAEENIKLTDCKIKNSQTQDFEDPYYTKEKLIELYKLALKRCEKWKKAVVVLEKENKDLKTEISELKFKRLEETVNGLSKSTKELHQLLINLKKGINNQKLKKRSLENSR